MASIYRRKGSRFWWCKYRENGKLMAISTAIDATLPGARRRAMDFAAKRRDAEMESPATREAARWEAWAKGYFKSRYAGTGSDRNARVALHDLMIFFVDRGIRTPRMVTYKVASEFVPWRVGNTVLDPIRQNTAKLRFLYFSILMAEAVRRGFADFNPCRDVKVRREPAKIKNEITAEDEAKIIAALKSAPEWMRDQFTVMMRQGCRVAETRCPLDQITDTTITFKIKGGRFHTASLHPDILPIVAKARERRQSMLIMGSPNDAARWCDFFSALKLPYSSHCCRVTVITRLLRAGHSPALVASFIGHSEEIQRVYRRLKPQDSAALLATLAAAPTP